jgi:hypothetical protein
MHVVKRYGKDHFYSTDAIHWLFFRLLDCKEVRRSFLPLVVGVGAGAAAAYYLLTKTGEYQTYLHTAPLSRFLDGFPKIQEEIVENLW